MLTAKEITALRKSGELDQAYIAAREALEVDPQDLGLQRSMGWVLYDLLKRDLEQNLRIDFLHHLEEVYTLDLLNHIDDTILFRQLPWKIANFFETCTQTNEHEINQLFDRISKLKFPASEGYSRLLQLVLKQKGWSRLLEFIEWWGFDKLQLIDYEGYKNEKGQRLMSLAEKVYNAYAKLLLEVDDQTRMKKFIPKISWLADTYPQMTYPGYYSCKLILASGEDREEALKVILPFARKKKSDSWVWAFLSELHNEKPEIYHACLLRASHTRSEDTYLVNIYKKLFFVYIAQNDLPRARYYLGKVTACYLREGWRLPQEVKSLADQPWVNEGPIETRDSIDYMKYTDSLLAEGANESFAVVTYVDQQTKRVALVYQKKKSTITKLNSLGIRVHEGSLLRLKWMPLQEDKIQIVGAEIANPNELKDTNYIKSVYGVVRRIKDKGFAFVKALDGDYFVPPSLVQSAGLDGDEEVLALVAYTYDKKKDEWKWTCVSIKKK